MVDTPNLGVTLMGSNQSQKHVTFNNAALDYDILIQMTIQDRGLNTPPGSPNSGDRYIVGSAPTGLWTGKADNIAAYINGSWKFFAPLEGWTAYVLDESTLYQWDGADWVEFTLTVGGSAGMFGVNTTADTTNRLSVKSDAVLFSHDDVTPGSGDMTLKINKDGASDDAILNFQTGFSARALLGLNGNDDFSLSVSPDGSGFFQAFTVDKDTGNVAIGTSSDATNKFLVSGENLLFTNSGDLRFTFSKGAAGDDVALTFQDNFSARALVGLLGNDDFTFKVSPDGSTFYDGFVIDKDDGSVAISQNSKFQCFYNFDFYVAADTWTDLAFNNNDHNDFGDVSSGVFTAPVPGYYLFHTKAFYKINGANPSDAFRLRFAVNGTGRDREMGEFFNDWGLVSFMTQTSALLKLSAGDTVEVQVYMGTYDGYVEADNNFFYGVRVA